MDFNTLTGQIYNEFSLYEEILAEVEDHLEKYFITFVHFYFERLTNNRIKITKVCYFKNSEAMFKVSKAILGNKEFYQVYHNHGHVDIWKCQMDRKSKISIVYKDKTHTEETGIDFANLKDHVPMTKKEIREAFQEFSEILSEENNAQHSTAKKAI